MNLAGRDWKWLQVLLVAITLSALGAWTGFRLAGPITEETPIGRVSLEVGPSLTGDATAFVPLADWGVRADPFDAPLQINAELRSLERDALISAAEGDLSVLAATEAELQDAVRTGVARALGYGLAGATVALTLGTLLWTRLRPRWSLLATGCTLTLAALAGSGLAAQLSYDARAFESPTYFARGAELQRILEVAEDESVESEYGSTLASVLRSVSAVLAETPAVEPAGRELHVASDLHGNPLVIGPLSRFLGEGPLLIAGDFGQRGGEAEAAALAPRVAALSRQVIAVSGNHDSAALMERLVDEGVTVLEADSHVTEEGVNPTPIVEVDGIRIAGFPDPLAWTGEGDPTDRPVTFDDLPDPALAAEQALADLIAWFDSLPERPDVVMIHQDSLAQGLARDLQERDLDDSLTIVSGHDHAQHVDRFGDIVVVDGGSVGAGGAFDAGREPIGFATLRVAAQTPALLSTDLIAIEPFSGQAQASRVVIDAMCPEEDTCTFEPAELEGGVPAE